MINESEIDEINAEQVAWEWFAGAHPHEAYAKDPDRFWCFFHRRCPMVRRDEMAKMLEESA